MYNTKENKMWIKGKNHSLQSLSLSLYSMMFFILHLFVLFDNNSNNEEWQEQKNKSVNYMTRLTCRVIIITDAKKKILRQRRHKDWHFCLNGCTWFLDDMTERWRRFGERTLCYKTIFHWRILSYITHNIEHLC